MPRPAATGCGSFDGRRGRSSIKKTSIDTGEALGLFLPPFPLTARLHAFSESDKVVSASTDASKIVFSVWKFFGYSIRGLREQLNRGVASRIVVRACAEH